MQHTKGEAPNSICLLPSQPTALWCFIKGTRKHLVGTRGAVVTLAFEQGDGLRPWTQDSDGSPSCGSQFVMLYSCGCFMEISRMPCVDVQDKDNLYVTAYEIKSTR